MRLEKYVSEEIFYMSEEKLKEVYHPGGRVKMHYAFNNYRDDVQHILDLRDEVLKDYPDMETKDMTVWVISDRESIRHARVTTLVVSVPVEDYLKLRRERKVGIR